MTNNFYQIIFDLFEDTSIDSMNEDTSFRDLDEWSSLTGMSIIATIKDKYMIDFSPADLEKCKLFSDIFKVVESRIGK